MDHGIWRHRLSNGVLHYKGLVWAKVYIVNQWNAELKSRSTHRMAVGTLQPTMKRENAYTRHSLVGRMSYGSMAEGPERLSHVLLL